MGKLTKEKFILTVDTLSEVNDQLHEALLDTKTKNSEALRGELLLEEIFMRMAKHGDAKNATVTIHRRIGDVSLRLRCPGKEYNPLAKIADSDDADEDYYNLVILKANREKMGYAYKDGVNIVTINVHEMGSKQIYLTLLGMALGVLCGAVMEEVFSPELVRAFDTNIITTCRTLFLNALNMMIAPVIFFSVISGVTSLTDAADVGRLGGKLVGTYGLTTLIASALSLGIAYFIFSGDVPQVGELTAASASGSEVPGVSLLGMITGLIPKNLVDPIAKNAMLQIIFVAVLFGICINKLGDKVKMLHEFIEVMNTFCLRMILMIVSVIPIIAFFAMASLMFKIGLDSILVLAEMIGGQLFGSCLMMLVYASLIYFIGHISPLPFLRKIPSFMPYPLSTSSSNATMPFSLKFCTERLGISPKISAFSIPIGATVNMDGSCFYLSTASVMLARMYGIELTPDILFTIFVTVVALSIGAPGVTGGAFVCLASIVTAIGLPVEATAVILGIDPICSMIRTTFNSSGDIAVSTALASSEKMLDMEVYQKTGEE